MITRWLVLFVIFTGAVASAAMPATPKRPNILFALADDWGGGHAGAYGCTWIKTPAFDRVAREGLLFQRAYTPNAKCSPSRASILTGRNSWQLKEAGNHNGFFPAEFKTFADALREHGYFVARTGKGWNPGVALAADGSPREVIGRVFDARRQPGPTPTISDNDYAANFGDFLAAAPAGEPWFFWFGGTEPHRRYTAGSGAKSGKRLEDIDRVPGYLPDTATVRGDLLDYALEVEHFDRHLGRMLELLAARGELENTIVIVTSDNGMPFPRAKGQAYEAGNRLPLAIRWSAGIRAPGRAIEAPVSFVDLAPTFLEVGGVPWARSGLQETPGRAWTDLFAGGTPRVPRDHVLIGQERHDVGRPNDAGYPIRGIAMADLLYLENFAPERWPACNPETGYLNTDGGPTKTEILRGRTDPAGARFWQLAFGLRGAEELYDLRKDPDCLNNLATDPARVAAMAALRRQLHAELTAQGDPRMRGEGDVFDRYPVAQPAMRGFYEKWTRGEAPRTTWVEESDYEKTPVAAKRP